MPMPMACMRCATIGPVQALGLLWLCAACLSAQPVPLCETQHLWRAADGAGTWCCERCGAILSSNEAPLLDASAY